MWLQWLYRKIPNKPKRLHSNSIQWISLTLSYRKSLARWNRHEIPNYSNFYFNLKNKTHYLPIKCYELSKLSLIQKMAIFKVLK